MHIDAIKGGRLGHLGTIGFSGPDAVPFLQGQLSNDVQRLSRGETLLAALSTPQGRVAALFHLLPHTAGVLGILPREIVPGTLERLRRYVLRSKVRVEDSSDRFAVAGIQNADQLRQAGLPVPTRGAYQEECRIGVAMVGAVDTAAVRYWVVGESELLAARGLLGDGAQSARIEHDWRLADIRTGLPQVYMATREMFVAQMLNLDLIDGISFTKGCFTGQEVIARTQHLGRIKRRLFRLRLPEGSWTIGQAVRLSDGRSARLVDVVLAGREHEALAVLPLEASDGQSSSEAADSAETQPTSPSIDVTVLALPYAISSNAH